MEFDEVKLYEKGLALIGASSLFTSDRRRPINPPCQASIHHKCKYIKSQCH